MAYYTEIWDSSGKCYKNADIQSIYRESVSSPFLVNGEIISRIDGPAITFENGHFVWMLNGIIYNGIRQFRRISGITDEEYTILLLKYGMMKHEYNSENLD